jgi:hypothetical protein
MSTSTMTTRVTVIPIIPTIIEVHLVLADISFLNSKLVGGAIVAYSTSHRLAFDKPL